MRTPDVRIDTKLNKEVWSRGIRLGLVSFKFITCVNKFGISYPKDDTVSIPDWGPLHFNNNYTITILSVTITSRLSL